MSPKRECPPVKVLEELVQGRVAEPELSELSVHLEECSSCQEKAKTLLPQDTLLESLRAECPAADQIAEQVPRPLVEKLKLLRSSPGVVTTLGTADASAESGAHDAELDFLAPPQQADEIGRLGTYRVLQVLGKGGMGAVLLADDPHLDRKVALKVMLPKIASNPSARQRFLREARTAAKLRSDHIVTIHQVSEDRGVPFLAMELLAGTSLDGALQPGQMLPPAEILRIGREVAQGLAAAHAHGLVHRDIKPANLWLDQAHGGRVKILDFGLARSQQDDVQITQLGAILGTPAYMAPEQARGDREVDGRADLFSLGCVLYRLATGDIPFKADSTAGVLMALASVEPPPPRTLNKSIPRPLSEFIMQLLAKEPSKRPASAQEVITRLRDIERKWLPPAASTSTETRESTPRRRRPLMAALLGGALAGLLALAGGVFYIVTDHGTIEIHTEDDNIKIVAEKNGGKVTILDPKSMQTWIVDTGKYTVRLDGNPEGLEIELPNTFTLKRGEKQVVTIRKVPVPFATDGPENDTAKLELAKLQGTWTKASPDLGPLTPMIGKPGDNVDSLTFTDAKFVETNRGQFYRSGTVKRIEVKEKFNTIDLKITEVVGAISPSQAIYLIEGDTLKISYGDPRPTRFPTKEEDHRNFWTYRRAVPQAELAKLQGTWAIVSYEHNGKPLAGQHTLTVQGDKIIHNVNGQFSDGGTIKKIEVKEKFNTIDALVTKGPPFVVGKTSQGIYVIEGDILKLVTGDAGLGDPRPTELATKEGDGRHFGTYRRVAAADRIHEVRRFGESDGRRGSIPHGVAVSPDGCYVVLPPLESDPEQHLRVFELATGKPVATPEGGASDGNPAISAGTIALSSDGKTAISAVSGGIRQVGIAGHKVIAEWTTGSKEPDPNRPVFGVAIAPDGKHAFSASFNGEVVKWDLATGKSVLLFQKAKIPSMALSANGNRLAFIAEPPAGGGINRIHVFDATTTKEVCVIPTSTTSFGGVCLTPDGRHVAWGHADGTIRMWDIDANQEAKRLPFVKGEICALAFSPDGGRLLATTNGGAMRLWDARTGKRLDDYHAPSGVRVLAFTPDGRHVVTGHYDNYGRLYRMPEPLVAGKAAMKPGLLRKIACPGDGCGVAYTPDGKCVVVSSFNQAGVRILDVATGNELRHFALQSRSHFILSPVGSRILTFGQDSAYRVWDVEKGKEIRAFDAEGAAVWATFSPDGQQALGWRGKTLILWDVATGKEVRKVNVPEGVSTSTLRFTPNGKQVVSSRFGQDGKVFLWDFETGKLLRTFVHPEPIYGDGTSISPDGTLLLTSCEDRFVRLWDLATGKQVRKFEHADTAIHSTFSPDGRWVLSNSHYAQTVRLWDVATGEQMAEFKLLSGCRPRYMAFSPDGRQAAVAAHADSVFIYQLLEPAPEKVGQPPEMPQFLLASKRTGNFEIYLMNLDGTTAKRLTNTKANNQSPVWSPDGSRIAFSSDRDGADALYLMDADGSNVKQLARQTGSWSPDGKKILYHRDTDKGHQLFVMELAGGKERQLSKDGDAFDPCWSPDGKQIAFVSGRNGKGWHIYVMDADGGNVKEITKEGGYFGWVHPAWSPDGRRIAFCLDTRGLELCVVDIDGSNLKQLTKLGGINTRAAWSPDSKQIIFQHIERGNLSAPSPVYIMDADGGNQRILLQADGPGRAAFKPLPQPGKVPVSRWLVGCYNDVVWSVSFTPDNKYIMSTGHFNGLHDRATGAEVRRLDSGAAGWYMTMSRDGKYLLTSPNNAQAILWDAASGKEIRKLNAQQHGRSIYGVFSRDGRLAAINHWDKVHVWDLENGKELAVLPAAMSPRRGAVFTPDGKKLLVAQEGGSRYITAFDTASWKESARWPSVGDNDSIACIELSPDGLTLLAGLWHEDEIIVFDVAGGKPTGKLRGGGKRENFERHVTFCPDGKRALAAHSDGVLILWDVPAQKEIQRWQSGERILSVAISPDGKEAACGLFSKKVMVFRLPEPPPQPQLLFNRTGKPGTYLMNLDGTGEKMLSNHSAGWPTWSPDASKIAFQSDRDGSQQIYVMDANSGNIKQLTRGPGAPSVLAWSPDGTKILFQRGTDKGTQLFVMDAQGGKEQQLTGLKGEGDGTDACWSPDGKKIAFWSSRSGTGWRMYFMDADGGNVTEIKGTLSTSGYMYPAWSPDGSKIAYTQHGDGGIREIFVCDADGKEHKQLTRLGAINTFAAWSPDSKQIIFQHLKESNQPGPVYIMDADGRNQKILFEAPGAGRVAFKPLPVKAAVKEMPRFLLASKRTGNFDIYLMNLDGTVAKRLTDTTASNTEPAWSPNASKIAFVSDRDGTSNIYVMDADGSGVKQLTKGKTPCFSPAWSPDGKHIAYHGRVVRDDIFVMDADGSNQKNLTPTGSSGGYEPSWSADGKRIAFHSFRSGQFQVHVMDADGSNVKQLTHR